MNWEAIVWFGLMVVFLIVEAACPFHLVSIWFAAGSLAAVLVSILGGPIWLQIALFLVISGGMLLMFWPFIQKFLKPNLVKTNVDAVLNTQGYVTADINNLTAAGQVKLGSMEWAARSTSGQPIPEGTLVKADRIEGVKVFVSPVEVTTEVS